MHRKPMQDKKVCFKCGIEKPINEFYVHPQMGDGHLNKCKECTKKDSQEQYNLRMQSTDFILHERERNRERARRATPRKPTQEEKRNAIQRYFERYQEKRIAHRIFQYAFRAGRISQQPCAVCNTTVKVQAHHEDYSKPLDVVWLCVRHHHDRHIEIRKDQLLKKKQAA